MLSSTEFRKQGRHIVDWIADYLENIEKYPVKSQVSPGDIYKQLPENPPDIPDSFDQIMEDFKRVIIPGITHWQSPNFFAYFPANSSFPSILAEMITAGLGVQCMKWDTSPAAAELEEMVMNWLKKMIGLPQEFHGVIQDTASTATLCAIIAARERCIDFQSNENGLFQTENLRVYCSKEAHSSIEKAVKIAGLGRKNLVKIEIDGQLRLNPDLLHKSIKDDIALGYKPMCVVAALGTTGVTAIDPLEEIGAVCNEFKVWLHVDAAMSGSALILPEYRWMIKGIELADSLVFNPHKWMFTNFDCSAFFVKDKLSLIKTFQIVPEYLKTVSKEPVNDYCDWGIQLGRRFRALKLWTVIRSYGVKELQEKIRTHISLANILAEKIKNERNFELITPVTLNLVCFRYKPSLMKEESEINKLNESLLHKINASGKIYITHTYVFGKYTLRMVIGQTNVNIKHVNSAWELIKETAKNFN
jgi:aromatic-L-amino-acid/L-tryptophan decarboxylase